METKKIQHKFQKGWVAYSDNNKADFYKQKYSKIWSNVSVVMDFGLESTRNGKIGINYTALIMGRK